MRLCKSYKVTQVDIPGLKGEGDAEANGQVEPKPKMPR